MNALNANTSPKTAAATAALHNMTGAAQASEVEILSKLDVCKAIGVKTRCLEMMVLRGDFPPAVRIGRQAFWSRVSVDRWRSRTFEVQENWNPGED